MNKAQNHNEARLYEIFSDLGIEDFTVYEHKAVYTMDDINTFNIEYPGLDLKNLLIREKKTGRFFLLVVDGSRRVDMKHFKEVTGWKQVSFASDEELFELTGMIPGSVTPLALFNDTEHKIIVVLGNEITVADESALICFHPCRNTATLVFKKCDFIKFLRHIGCEIIFE